MNQIPIVHNGLYVFVNRNQNTRLLVKPICFYPKVKHLELVLCEIQEHGIPFLQTELILLRTNSLSPVGG